MFLVLPQILWLVFGEDCHYYQVCTLCRCDGCNVAGGTTSVVETLDECMELGFENDLDYFSVRNSKNCCVNYTDNSCTTISSPNRAWDTYVINCSTPTGTPNEAPTLMPTGTSTESPAGMPTEASTGFPSEKPTGMISEVPTGTPIVVTWTPTGIPTWLPTTMPTKTPTGFPSKTPTGTPTEAPTGIYESGNRTSNGYPIYIYVGLSLVVALPLVLLYVCKRYHKCCFVKRVPTIELITTSLPRDDHLIFTTRNV